MILCKKRYYSLAFLALSVLIIPFINLFQHQFKLETSVWCFGHSNQTSVCKFKNICYDPQYKALLFFLNENSVIKGFDHYDQLKNIQLSSVQQHNQFYANLSVIDVKNFKLSKELKVFSKGILLSRFKPNNLMHCIHDDLLPLYLTLESVCLGDINCMQSYILVFHDHHPRGPLFSLYELFSEQKPIILSELISSDFLLCFKEIMTGLVQDSLVYQYGFKKPHGPLKPTHLTQKDISRFTLFLKNKLHIFDDYNDALSIILLSRQKNRKILNIEKVREMIERAYQKFNKKINIKQIDLNLFSHDFKTLIKIISNADGLIGMHGAEIILSLFLKPKSFVFELFPFGINPQIVSFIKPISELRNCNFMYFSWKNMLKNNSISHPDAPPLFGGISHLDITAQVTIKKTKEVPAVECCNNPLFLYHMYQDTLISDEFENFLYGSLLKTLSKQADSGEAEVNKWLHPYIVLNISCSFQPDLKVLYISWNHPFNVENNNLMYSLHIRDKIGLFSKVISTENTNVEVKAPAGTQPEFEVWISAYFTKNGFKSSDLYINCK